MSADRRSRPAPKPTVNLFLRVDPELKERISRLSLSRRCYEARLVEQALREFLDAEERAPRESEPGK